MFKLLSRVIGNKLKNYLLLDEMANDESISWYHGNLSREDVEEVFKSANQKHVNSTNGLFLVRDSSTTSGDFVLSVQHKGEIVHYQIRRHGEDAFFSINGQTIFHGLETLIEYYREDAHGLECSLGEAIKKEPPPPDTRRDGRTNLLHRATKEKNLVVVSELLKCGYRNIDAKNQDGQTAVHLASSSGEEAILEKLISSGANVNCRDKLGNTPLHYACQNNLATVVKILITGSANVQLRNTNTDWVALHEAASRGHKEIVELLLYVAAPARPRTKDKKTPQQLAEENGYYQVAQILKTHEGGKPKTTREDWYHGTLTRDDAISLLGEEEEGQDGTFLIRYSHRTGYVLTMMCSGQPYHYVISNQGPFYVIDDGPLLDSLEHLVEHYMTMSDGLPTTLQVPVKPRPKPPLPNFHPAIKNFFTSTLPSKPRRGHRWSEGNATTLPLPPKTKPRRSVDANMNSANNINVTQQDSHSQVFIARENIILKDVIGEGEFGSVYKAVCQERNGTEMVVAVKTLHPEHIVTNRQDFLHEAELMLGLNHHCIVKLVGICQSDTFLMVQELVPLGSMLTFILEHPDQASPEYELHVWASQIACGMHYLEEHRCVHRDLAARNILLATRHQAKISDFGLSRSLVNEREYYKATKGGRWPIKWYAPESYNYGTFSSASDVWSFGVTLWEMFSYGQQPFGDRRGVEVIEMIDNGERLEKPDLCPPEVYQIMEKCWAYQSRNRPSFKELLEFFSSHTNYENVRELIAKTDIS